MSSLTCGILKKKKKLMAARVEMKVKVKVEKGKKFPVISE